MKLTERTNGVPDLRMKTLRFESTCEPISEARLFSLEAGLGFSLPKTYRSFLLDTNGGRVADENSCFFLQKDRKRQWFKLEFFYSVVESDFPRYEILRNSQEFAGRIPRDLVPIAHDGFGNQILLGVEGGHLGNVFFWNHEEEGFRVPDDQFHNVTKVADTFDEFVDRLLPYDSMPG